MSINHIKVVDTTMEIASEYLKEKKPSFTTIYADYQKKGRGRSLNRKWETSINDKNVLLSTIIRKEDIKINIVLIPLVVGCAIRESLKDLFNINAEIKWPNDLILNHKKIAGIICESNKNGVVIGLGLNVYERNFSLDSYKVTPSSLFLENIKLDINQDTQIKSIIDSFLHKLQEYVNNYNFINIINKNLYMKNKNVKFSFSSADSIDTNKHKIISGNLDKVDTDGAILIDGKKYYSGELLI